MIVKQSGPNTANAAPPRPGRQETERTPTGILTARDPLQASPVLKRVFSTTNPKITPGTLTEGPRVSRTGI